MRSTPWRWITGSTVPSSIDAARHDLDRLVDRLSDPFQDRGLGHGEPDQPAADIVDVDGPLAGGAEQPAERLRQLAQLGEALLQVAFADAHLDAGAAHDRGAHEADLGLAQDLAHLVAQLLDLFLADRGGVDFEQDVRAALQVETEHDMALRPFRPALDRRCWTAGSEPPSSR